MLAASTRCGCAVRWLTAPLLGLANSSISHFLPQWRRGHGGVPGSAPVHPSCLPGAGRGPCGRQRGGAAAAGDRAAVQRARLPGGGAHAAWRGGAPCPPSTRLNPRQQPGGRSSRGVASASAGAAASPGRAAAAGRQQAASNSSSTAPCAAPASWESRRQCWRQPAAAGATPAATTGSCSRHSQPAGTASTSTAAWPCSGHSQPPRTTPTSTSTRPVTPTSRQPQPATAAPTSTAAARMCRRHSKPATAAAASTTAAGTCGRQPQYATAAAAPTAAAHPVTRTSRQTSRQP